mmetsp:Transcript_4636/g.20952  ORF Transcript_4636/g.20952 Transcript_4636/m.20952 type:complete len:342 (-) Transcript_4636:297-1322(-)
MSILTLNRISIEHLARWNGCLPLTSIRLSSSVKDLSSSHLAAPCHRSNESNTIAGPVTNTCASSEVSSGNSNLAISSAVSSPSPPPNPSPLVPLPDAFPPALPCHSGLNRRLVPGIHVFGFSVMPFTLYSFSASESSIEIFRFSNFHSRSPPSLGRHTTKGDCHTCPVGSIALRAIQMLTNLYWYRPRSGMARSVQPSFGRCGVLGLVQLSGSLCSRVAKWILELTTCPSGRRITQSMASSSKLGSSHPVPGSTFTHDSSPKCLNCDLMSSAPASKSSGQSPACPLPCGSIRRHPLSRTSLKCTSAGSSRVGRAMKSFASTDAMAPLAASLMSTGRSTPPS